MFEDVEHKDERTLAVSVHEGVTVAEETVDDDEVHSVMKPLSDVLGVSSRQLANVSLQFVNFSAPFPCHI